MTRNEEVAARYMAGATVKQIAHEFGITHQRVSQISRSAGCAPRGYGGRWRIVRCEPCGLTLPVTKGPEHRRSRKHEEAVFWSRVARTGECWEWQGSRTTGGYGAARLNRRSGAAHRISLEIATGPLPAGAWVLHHCDNPPCVRPDHLYAGTPLDNARDRTARSRKQTSLTPQGVSA